MEHSHKHLHLVWKLGGMKIAHTSPGASWGRQQKQLHRSQLSECLDLNPLGDRKRHFFYSSTCTVLVYSISTRNGNFI